MDKPKTRIALVGKKATGKSFVAFYLKYHYHFKRMKLQDGIDKIVRTMYGLEKYKRPSWEQKLDMYDALYKVDPNIHISHLVQRLKQTTMLVVCEDARYLNEVDALAKIGFLIVRITTDETQRKLRIPKVQKAAAGTVILNEYYNHDPARAIKADYTIINNTREATRRSVDLLMEQLGIIS